MTRAFLPIALAAIAGCSDYEVTSLESADIFYQLEASEVDILLVVDNSCSMQPYQQKLATSFDSFLTYFLEGDVDYQIGVTTTSLQGVEYLPAFSSCTEQMIDAIPAPGALVGGTIITPDTADADQTFSDIVNVGVCGSGSEMGLGSARLALQHANTGAFNTGFLRDTAYLSLIFVSDELDASPLPVNDYINEFRDSKTRGGRESVIASALVVSDVNDCSMAQQGAGASAGSRYIDVAEQTGGLVGDICGDDFETIVTELSLNSSRLTDIFYLTSLPEVGSLLVGISADGEVYEIDCATEEWTYELQGEGDDIQGTIVFDRAFLPPPNSKITVKYNPGTGDPTNFCVAAE